MVLFRNWGHKGKCQWRDRRERMQERKTQRQPLRQQLRHWRILPKSINKPLRISFLILLMCLTRYFIFSSLSFLFFLLPLSFIELSFNLFLLFFLLSFSEINECCRQPKNMHSQRKKTWTHLEWAKWTRALIILIMMKDLRSIPVLPM